MHTATLIRPGHFEITKAEIPRPGPGEVIIRVRGCGVCASNLGPWEGVEGIGYPMDAGAPGHEVYGTITETGEGVEELRPGQAVTALSYHGFADYDVAHADAVVPVPDTLADAAQPILGEPLACAVNVSRRAAVDEGDTVVVVGIGFLGALLVRLVRRARPRHVIAVSRRPEALVVAEQMGADIVMDYEDEVGKRIAELTGGRMADVVIEATGKEAPLDLAGELTRVRGRLVIAGYHQGPPRRVNLQLWNWHGLDVINAHERERAVYTRGMKEGVRLIEEGVIDLDPLISHILPLSEINQAFELARSRPEGFFKAVVSTEDER